MKHHTTTRRPETIAAFVAIIWLGMLLGVSFIATPVKFEAPSLSLPVALEIGRVTFSLFSRIEWGIALLLVMSLLACRCRTVSGFIAAALVAILIAETFWLLPVLDARVEAIISGVPAPAGWHHVTYIGIEVIKAAALVALSIHLLGRLSSAATPAEGSKPGA